MADNIKIFGITSSIPFAQKITEFLNLPLSQNTSKYFDDTEFYIRSTENVRGKDVYVVHSLHASKDESVAEKLVQLLLFIGSIKDASAERITAVIPYLCFARQDRKVLPREPISTRYIAQLLEAAGCSRVITMDVHSLSAFQNSFRINIDNLESKNLLAHHIASRINKYDRDNLVVLSPDSGGVGRSQRFRNTLSHLLKTEIGLAYFDKSRIGSTVKGNHIVGDIKDKKVIIIDDMISSGSTLKKCDEIIKKYDGQTLAVCAVHGLFVGNVEENLNDIEKIIITDTVSNYINLNDNFISKLEIVSTTKLFADAIRMTSTGESISSLFY